MTTIFSPLNPALMGGFSVSTMAAAPPSTIDQPEIIRAPVREKKGPVFDHGTPDGKFDQLPEFDPAPKHSLLTRRQKIATTQAPQFDEEPVDKLLRHFEIFFSKPARKVLKECATKNAVSDSVVIEKLYHNLKMYLRDPQKNIMARLGVEKCLSHFGLMSEFGLNGFRILTTDENTAREDVITYTSDVTALAPPQDSVPYEDPFEARANAIRQQLLNGEAELVAESCFYPDRELASAKQCLVMWCAIFPKLENEEVVAIFKAFRSSQDLAQVIAHIYSPHNTDRLMEIKLVQILSLLENKELDATFAALLENRETRGVGVSIMMDAQLFGGLQRALQFELMYERLVRTHDHWYPDYIDVVLNHSVVVGDETGFIGVRRLSIKEAYLLRLKGVREAAGPTTQSIALRILTNMAFRKDCPYETKERIAGVLLEYATDNMFKDIREAALEQLGRFRTTFYGDLDDAVNFALGADLRKKVEIQVALRTGKRGLTRLKELVEHKAYYSREALIAYRQKTADISGLDIMGIDIKGLSWTGSHITLAQLGYIRAHETPNPDTVSIDLTIDGASEAELLSYEGSLSRAAIVDTPLSKEAILTLMERGATVSYSLKHYWEYHFTEEELKRIYEAEDYKFFVDIFTHQSDTNTQRFCLTYLGHLFDPLDRDDFTTPALKAKKYHAEALKNFHPRGTYLLLYIACDEKQDYAVRELALREIKELDAEQIKKLGKTARGRYTDAIRLEAMIALGRNGSHKAVDELKVCLEDKPLPGSARAIHAITNHQVLSRLMDLTKHPHDTIQEAAYEAIGAIIAEHEISRELAQDTLSMSSDCVYLQILFDKTLKHQMRSNVLEAAINTYNIFLNKWKIHFTNDHLNAQFDENNNADALVTIVLENRSTSSSNQAMVILKTFAHLPVVEAALAKIVAESSQNNVLTAVLEGLTPETDTMLDALVSLVKRKSDYAQQAITVIGRSQNPKAVDTLVKLYELELRYDDATKLMKTLKGIATSNKPTTMTMQAANVLINFAKKQQERIFVDRENPDYDAITSVSELAQDNTLGLEIQQPAINFMWTTKRELCVPLARKVLMENAPVDFQQEAIYVMGQYYFYWETEDQRILEHVALNGVTEDLRKQAMETLNQHRPVGPESV